MTMECTLYEYSIYWARAKIIIISMSVRLPACVELRARDHSCFDYNKLKQNIIKFLLKLPLKYRTQKILTIITCHFTCRQNKAQQILFIFYTIYGKANWLRRDKTYIYLSTQPYAHAHLYKSFPLSCIGCHGKLCTPHRSIDNESYNNTEDSGQEVCSLAEFAAF